MASTIHIVTSLAVIYTTVLTGLAQGRGSTLRIITKPKDYHEKADTQLTITCIADTPTNRTTKIITMYIRRDGQASPMASVDIQQDLVMGPGSKDEMKAEGRIGNNSSKSYLTLIMNKPSREEAGLYTCTMVLLVEHHEIVQENATALVTFDACPDEGWDFYNKDKTCLKVFGEGHYKNWTMSRHACRQMGADLVVVRNEDKNTFVAKMAADSSFAWIGLKNHAGDGYDFRHVDGSNLKSYRPWASGEPNGDGPWDGKCVVMWTDPEEHGKWHDQFCSFSQPYVCSTRSRGVF